MTKYYLKNYDRTYTTGAYLEWNDKEKIFEFDGIEEDTFFDGEPVNFDDMDRPYIEMEEKCKHEENAICQKCADIPLI